LQIQIICCEYSPRTLIISCQKNERVAEYVAWLHILRCATKLIKEIIKRFILNQRGKP
jgi:hypothetical protein